MSDLRCPQCRDGDHRLCVSLPIPRHPEAETERCTCLCWYARTAPVNRRTVWDACVRLDLRANAGRPIVPASVRRNPIRRSGEP